MHYIAWKTHLTVRSARSAGAFTLRLAYGYEVQGGPGEDAFVNLAEELARVTGVASEPGRWLVDAFPWRTFGANVEV